MWAVIAVVLMSVFNNFSPRSGNPTVLSYSQFIEEVRNAQIRNVTIDGRTVKGNTTSGGQFSTYAPDDPEMINDLLAHNVEIQVNPPEKRSLLFDILIS